jgi:predicted glycogen debranching enzyme
MDDDGLISAGSPRTQLTWMDAAVGAIDSPQRVVFTPRQGKAVEINALWFNALLAVSEQVRDSHPSAAKRYEQIASRVKRSFTKVFWDDQLAGLIDHVFVDGAGNLQRDRSIRPNQILAVSLPRSPLAQAKAAKVLALVRQKLLTPMGLRTLAPDDRQYHGRYTGHQFQRDEAYHQGTIWPWLIGPYAEAVLRVGRFSQKSRAEAHSALTPLLDRITGEGLGQLHEIFEAHPVHGAHRPVGCIAQAWSIAELLRVWQLIDRAG